MSKQQKASDRATNSVEARSKNNKDNIIIKKTMTQCEMIFEYMVKQGKINPIDVLRHVGSFSLYQCIGDLKRAGHNIISERVRKLGRFGNKISFAEYHLSNNEVKGD